MADARTPYGDDHPTGLSPPAPREEVHNRRISCNGFVREDGLYDIEAEITDNKTYTFPTSFRGDVTPDMYVHHMKVRVTINPELEIVAAEAVTVAGPYAICPTANDVFDSLVGLTIGPGWRRRVTAAIGGRHGCTHITELMGPIDTIAFQTRYGEEARKRRARLGSDGRETSAQQQGGASVLANSCVAYATD
jgi:hypothetical protein